jgi:hypothetical protein
VICRLTGILGLMGQLGRPVIITLSAVLTFYPLSGLSLADYILSLNPNYSIGSVALFFVLLWGQFGWRPLLSQKDLLWFSIWNVVVSLCLYISYLGFISFDLYPLGYKFSALFIISALLTAILFLFHNPLSYIFITYIAAFNLKLLSSDNFFDYITDGILFIISLSIVIYYIAKSIFTRQK